MNAKDILTPQAIGQRFIVTDEQGTVTSGIFAGVGSDGYAAFTSPSTTSPGKFGAYREKAPASGIKYVRLDKIKKIRG